MTSGVSRGELDQPKMRGRGWTERLNVLGRSARTQGGPYVRALHARDKSESEMLGGQRVDVVRVWRQVLDQRFRRWSIKGNYCQA